MKLFKTAALAVAVSMIGLSVVGDAGAVPAHAYLNTYYSDAAHTSVVGEQEYNCSGSPVLMGVRSAYMHHEDFGECSNWSGGEDPCDLIEYMC